jgi:hypothetical protein
VIAVKLFILLCFFAGSFIGLGDDKSSSGDSIDKFDLDSLAYIFGNINFAFLMHHTIPGIVYPLR